MVITQADKHISNYYEVILNKLEKQKEKAWGCCLSFPREPGEPLRTPTLRYWCLGILRNLDVVGMLTRVYFLFLTCVLELGPRQALGRVAVWMRRALHREVLREFARCRHQALDRALLRPTASYAGDPEECRRADGSPQEPGIGNVFDGSGDRAVFSGAGGRSRGA